VHIAVTFAKVLEANYPELLHRLYLVNGKLRLNIHVILKLERLNAKFHLDSFSYLEFYVVAQYNQTLFITRHSGKISSFWKRLGAMEIRSVEGNSRQFYSK